MYIELQLAAPVFARMLENRLKALKPCLSYIEFDAGGETLVVDKVEIVDPTTIQRDPLTPRQTPAFVTQSGSIAQITVPFLQVKPTINVTVVKKSDLIANSSNPSTPFAVVPVQPIYDVAAFVGGPFGVGGPVQLTYTLHSVDFGSLAGFVPAASLDAIQGVLAGLTPPPTTMDFSQLLGTLQLQAAAINCGITCDKGSPAMLVALRVEVQAETDSVAAFTSFFNDGPMNRLEGRDWALFLDSRLFVAQAENQIKIGLSNALDFDLTSGPDASWNGSGIDISFKGTALGACKALGSDIDVEATMTLNTSVPTVDMLRTQLHLDVSSNLFEVALCTATTALLWPFVGLAMLGEGDVNIAEYLIGLVVHPLLRMVALLFAAETQGLSDDLSTDLGTNWHKVDDDDYESDAALDAAALKLPGLGAQLEFDGSTTTADGIAFGGSVIDLRDYPTGSVDVHATPFTWKIGGNCQTHFTTINQATITVDVEGPAKLCSAQLQDTSPTDYSLAQNDDKVLLAPVIGVDEKLPTTSCTVIVLTTDGTRIIRFSPPVPETAEENTALSEAKTVAAIKCLQLTGDFNLLDKIRWLPDPPSSGDYLQVWQIFVENLQGQTVGVRNAEGDSVLTWHGSSAHNAQMMVLLDKKSFTKSLSIHLEGHQVPEKAKLKVSVRQILLGRRSSVAAPDSLTQLSFAGGRGAPRLVAGSAKHTSVWSVRAPTLPVLQESMAKTPRGMGMAMHGGTSISTEMPSKVDVALRSAWARDQDYSIIGNPKTGSFKETLYIGSQARGTLYDISIPQKPVTIQVFHTRPWFVGTAYSAKLLARSDVGARAVNIYQVLAEHQV